MLDSFKLTPLYISLGAYCKTAFQIRRCTGDDEAYFYDWLITLNNSFDSIFMDDDKFFQADNWEILVDAKFRLLDKGTGLIFQHEFPVLNDDSKFINSSKVDDHLQTAKAKFLYLKKKTLDKISNSSSVFLIRQENISDVNSAISRLGLIKKSFSHLNKNIKFVLVSETINSDLSEGNFFVFKEDLSDKWSGDNASWDRIFQALSSEF